MKNQLDTTVKIWKTLFSIGIGWFSISIQVKRGEVDCLDPNWMDKAKQIYRKELDD